VAGAIHRARLQSYFGHYWKERARVIDPNVSELTTQLAEIVTRNAASAVTSRISAIRARKLDQQAMNELIELVNDLIADKNELIGVATAFEQELVAQRISDKDITYITTTLLPVVEQLANFADDAEEARGALDAIKSLVTPETLTIMQLVGFNFRRAIGEPLTTLIERLILSRVLAPDQSAELQSPAAAAADGVLPGNSRSRRQASAHRRMTARLPTFSFVSTGVRGSLRIEAKASSSRRTYPMRQP
jgi:hypothetical protein